MTDPDGDWVRIEVEVRPTDRPFTEKRTANDEFAADRGEASGVMSLDMGRYHWQYRAVDEYGESSGWMGFGGNPETDADFIVMASGSTNSSTDLPGCGLSASASGSAAGTSATLLLLALALRAQRPR